MKWIKASERQPSKRGVYKIKGLNNWGDPVEDNIWWTGLSRDNGFIIREGCKILEWLDESEQSEQSEPLPESETKEEILLRLGKLSSHKLSIETFSYPEYVVLEAMEQYANQKLAELKREITAYDLSFENHKKKIEVLQRRLDDTEKERQAINKASEYLK